MNRKTLHRVLDDIQGKEIAVVGDMMLDYDIGGVSHRQSPEAECPVLYQTWQTLYPGGAANAAKNVAALGGHALPIGVVGDDLAGDLLRSHMDIENINPAGILPVKHRSTTTKKRIYLKDAHLQVNQILRLDTETTEVPPNDVQLMIDHAVVNSGASGTLISDYGKGVVNRSTMDAVRQLWAGVTGPIVVDPKHTNVNFYSGAHWVTPNAKEFKIWMETWDDETKTPPVLALNMCKHNRFKGMLIKKGGEGMDLLVVDGPKWCIEPLEVLEAAAAGAGDSVAAAFTLALSVQATPLEAAEFANIVGGLGVAKGGTCVVNLGEVRDHANGL